MSRSIEKTQAEFEQDAILQYEEEHSGPFPMEELAEKLLREGWSVRTPSAKSILTRRLKRRARELRSKDPQGRSVRTMHAAKISKISAAGEQSSETVYDHHLGMSFDHALTSFQQRFGNCRKQENALWRDLDSFNENNPNAKLQKIQKEFLFADDDPAEPPSAEVIEETGNPIAPR